MNPIRTTLTTILDQGTDEVQLSTHETPFHELTIGTVCQFPLCNERFKEEAVSQMYHLSLCTSEGNPVESVMLPPEKCDCIGLVAPAINDSVSLLYYNADDNHYWLVELCIFSVSFQRSVPHMAYAEVQSHTRFTLVNGYAPTHIPFHLTRISSFQYMTIQRDHPQPFNRPKFVSATYELLVRKGDCFSRYESGVQYEAKKPPFTPVTQQLAFGLFVRDTRVTGEHIIGELFQETLVLKKHAEKHPGIILELRERFRLTDELVWIGTTTGETILGRKDLSTISLAYVAPDATIQFQAPDSLPWDIVQSVKHVFTKEFDTIAERRHNHPVVAWT